MKVNPESLARASSHHPWRTIVIWVALFFVMGGLVGTLLSGVLTNDIAFTNKPESIKAKDVIDAKFTAKEAGKDTEYLVVGSTTNTVDDQAFQDYVTTLKQAVIKDASSAKTDYLAANPSTYYDIKGSQPDQAAGLVSKDRNYMLIPLALADDGNATVTSLRSVISDNAASGFTTQLAGQAAFNYDFTKIAQEDANKGEAIGVAVALIVLVIVFGAILAALLPIGVAIVAIVIALGLTTVIGQLVHFQVFVTDIVGMIGLAVGIDYSLFIVSRYREERKKGFQKLDAIAASGATASRAVFFSGITVVLALMGMFIIPTTIFRSLAGGAMLVTLVSIAGAMTLLPAVLALLGDRTDWPYVSRFANVPVLLALIIAGGIGAVVVAAVSRSLAPLVFLAIAIAASIPIGRSIKRGRLKRFHHPEGIEYDVRGGFWDKLTKSVMARPVVFLVIGAGILIGLGSFYFQLNRGNSTNINQLPNVPSKAAFLTLQSQFAGGLSDPVQIVVTGDVSGSAAQQGITNLKTALGAMPVFSPTTQVVTSADGKAVQVNAYFKGDSQDASSIASISDLRSNVIPKAFAAAPGVQVFVGGQTAIYVDFLHVTDHYQWIVLAFVLGLSFLLLMVVFRSVVVPLKAIIMNLLSVFAAYGAVTLVFQKGVGIGFFNSIGFHFHQSNAVEAWLPLFLFSILFGLSMDYHVFLLSRIREEYDKTHDNTEAVAYGLRTTAGIITGAAIIMVVVFTGFASGRLGPLQQMGFGLAVAVLLDATIVRCLLVPATMRLLGDANWYLPKWLEWLPKVNVEGHEPELAMTIPDTPAELIPAAEGPQE